MACITKVWPRRLQGTCPPHASCSSWTMKTRFPGYFRPTPPEFDKLWQSGIIVPDANILLHLLRYGPETREQVLATLRAFRPRLWVPYQVAFEFLRRWRTVDAENRSAYEKLKTGLRRAGNSLAGQFDDFARHQVINAHVERAKIETFINDLCIGLDEAAKKHPTVQEAEAIVDQIAELVGDSVGKPPSLDERTKWISQAEKRYAARTPPGFEDANKEGVDKFGDYFIWEEMVGIALERSLPVIFVSDDRKDDWVLRHGGQDIGPRPELVEEFASRTQQNFYNYPLRMFLERAKGYVSVEVTPNAIAEIEEEEQRRARRDEEESREIAALKEQRDLASATSVGMPFTDALRNVQGLGLATSVGTPYADALRNVQGPASATSVGMPFTDALRNVQGLGLAAGVGTPFMDALRNAPAGLRIQGAKEATESLPSRFQSKSPPSSGKEEE